jgi:hypothetical protein
VGEKLTWGAGEARETNEGEGHGDQVHWDGIEIAWDADITEVLQRERNEGKRELDWDQDHGGELGAMPEWSCQSFS